MIDNNVKKVAQDIKELKIQGASQIELAAIDAILKYITNSTDVGEDFAKNVLENINELVKQRPNEPKLRNSLNYILNKANENKFEDTRDKIIKEINSYEENTKKANDRISEIASQMITDGSTIYTHCHSHLVENAFKKAHDRGVKFKVIATETRPRFQGHITTKQLSDYGIDVTIAVDGAVASFVKKADLFISGADVIFADGSIMNKIGTLPASIVSNYYKTPHVVLTSTHCCESNLLLNLNEKVEQRNPNEVWDEKERPKDLKVLNPSFDIIPNELIDKFITEEGIFSPETLYLWVNRFNIDK